MIEQPLRSPVPLPINMYRSMSYIGRYLWTKIDRSKILQGGNIELELKLG